MNILNCGAGICRKAEEETVEEVGEEGDVGRERREKEEGRKRKKRLMSNGDGCVCLTLKTVDSNGV